jgi:hypothetical protein
MGKQMLRARFRAQLDPSNDITMKQVVVELFNEILHPKEDEIEKENQRQTIEVILSCNCDLICDSFFSTKKKKAMWVNIPLLQQR